MFHSGEKMSGFNGRDEIATHVHLHKFVALCAGEERGQQYTVPRAAIYVPWPLYGAAGVSAMQHAVARRYAAFRPEDTRSWSVSPTGKSVVTC